MILIIVCDTDVLVTLPSLRAGTENIGNAAGAGRGGDRPVHDVPGVEHRPQGACPGVHVQPVPDRVLGLHLLHLLWTMDRHRVVRTSLPVMRNCSWCTDI